MQRLLDQVQRATARPHAVEHPHATSRLAVSAARRRRLHSHLQTAEGVSHQHVQPGEEFGEADFVAPVLYAAWAGAVAVPAELSHLAQTQFETYAKLLAEPQSCMASAGGRPDAAAVDHAREYLNGFGGFQHVYQSMLADAGKQSPSVRFNDKFTGSSRYIVDSYEVPGAFTKTGFAFMQNAIQHPEPYYSGEEWVLGPSAGSMPGPATLIAQLQKQYLADYLTGWRAYLNAARFVGFQSWNDAAGRLSYLDSPSSPILELFSLISINTGVALPEIANAFQAPQSVVPRPIPATASPPRPTSHTSPPSRASNRPSKPSARTRPVPPIQTPELR